MKTTAAVLIATLASASLFAAPALAQSTSEPAGEDSAQVVADILAELSEKLRPLAAPAGLEFPELSARMDPLFRAAIPSAPTTGRDWSVKINFNNTDAVTEDGTATDGRQGILPDAQACAEAYPGGGRVVFFRRIRQSGLIGHQCVLAAYQNDLGVLVSLSYAEGADRHFVARYDVSASVTDDPEGVCAMLEPVVESNVALAVAFVDLAVESAVRAAVADD